MERKLSVMLIAVFCLLFAERLWHNQRSQEPYFPVKMIHQLLVLPSKFRVLKWVPQLISMESSVWRM